MPLLHRFFSSVLRDPVSFWLRELGLVHEAECTIMLQSKPVSNSGSGNNNNNNNNNSSSSSSSSKFGRSNVQEEEEEEESNSFWSGNSSKDTIRAIQSRAHSISAVFAKLCRSVLEECVIHPIVQSLEAKVYSMSRN